jgi:ATP-binding cassette subfamily C protein
MMIDLVARALKFLTRLEKTKFFTLLLLKSLVGLLDLAAIMAIGVLSSSLVMLLSDQPGNFVELGPITLSALTSESIPLVGLFILLLFVSKAILSIFLTHRLAHFLARIEARAARKIATNSFGHGLEGIRRFSKDEILYFVQVGSPSAFNTLLNSLGTLVTEGFLFLLVIGAFTLINPWAALGALAYFGVVGVLIQHFIGRRVQDSGQIITESAIKSSSGLLDLSEVIREATTLGKKDFFLDNVYQARMTSAKNVATQLVLQGAPRHIVETALIVGIATFIFLQSLSGNLSLAAVTIGVFLAGGLRLTAALLPLQNALLSINQSRPAAERALNVLEDNSFNDAPSSFEDKIAVKNNQPVEVKIESLSFSYPEGPEVLSKISLKIPPGSQAAFIGPSGAGKSTLADLVLGLARPTSGKVWLDGVELSEWVTMNPGALGYVPQKPGMISGTIRENIAIGVDSMSIDERILEKAVTDAHLGPLIESLPEGLDTNIGKQKDEFSGGQLQRIGLARALYFQPSLLVMDEATSALDAESENEINKALTEMRGKVTVILIAHRLNTVQRSDIVFLLEQGKISASGTFSELLNNNSTVKRLAELMAIDISS